MKQIFLYNINKINKKKNYLGLLRKKESILKQN